MPQRKSVSSATFAHHKERWGSCQLCELARGRNKIVLLRGRVPAPVLFCGEAPGQSENVLGRPFAGPAGRLLDQIIDRAGLTAQSYALTNLVACIPLDDDHSKLGQPSATCIKACAPRLADVVQLVRPRLVVWVGKLAAKWGPVTAFLPVPLRTKSYFHDKDKRSKRPIQVEIIHPAAILRMDISQQGLAVQRCVVTIADAWEEINASS